MDHYNLEDMTTKLKEQKYYDCNRTSDCTAVILDGKSVMPAGTTVYSMPLSMKNEEYEKIRKEYDIAFLFDDMPLQVSFYSVPRFDIMAIDSNGGCFGMLGTICDLEDGRPVYYVDSQRKTFKVAENGQEFIGKMAQWKESLVATEDMILFESKKDAVQNFAFIEL